MRVMDVLRLSAKNIKFHLKRNLMIAMVMGVIFSMILAMRLWFNGVENYYIEGASRVTNGKVIVMATNSTESAIINETKVQISRIDMIQDIEACGGKILGDARRFGVYGAVVLPEELVRDAVEVDLDKVPIDAAPVLVTTFLGEQLLKKSFSEEYVSVIKKQSDYETYRSDLIGKTYIDYDGTKYYVVGLASDSFHIHDLSFRQLESGSKNLMNAVLEMIIIPGGVPIVIDNGRSQFWQESGDLGDILETSGETIVAVFDDNDEAYEYLRNGRGAFLNTDFLGRDYTVTVVAGMSPEVTHTLRIMRIIMNFASLVLGIIAVIVVMFTSIRLVDQDKQNIALYYCSGATIGQVRAIYICYFLELMVGAMIFAFSLASLIVMGFSLVNQKWLEIQAMLGFNQLNDEMVWWYGINGIWLMVISMTLIMVMMCVFINNKVFKECSRVGFCV